MLKRKTQGDLCCKVRREELSSTRGPDACNLACTVSPNPTSEVRENNSFFCCEMLQEHVTHVPSIWACCRCSRSGFWHSVLHPLWLRAVCLVESTLELCSHGLHWMLGFFSKMTGEIRENYTMCFQPNRSSIGEVGAKEGSLTAFIWALTWLRRRPVKIIL